MSVGLSFQQNQPATTTGPTQPPTTTTGPTQPPTTTTGPTQPPTTGPTNTADVLQNPDYQYFISPGSKNVQANDKSDHANSDGGSTRTSSSSNKDIPGRSSRSNKDITRTSSSSNKDSSSEDSDRSSDDYN